MREIRTEITLDAPVDRVWELLADNKLYEQWNPLFPKATGVMAVGEELEIVISLPEMAPIVIKPKVLEFEPRSRYCWKHTQLSAGLFTWKYSIELVTLAPDRLNIIQTSVFGGILGPLYNATLATSVKAGMQKMNGALRRWGEKGNIQCLKC